MMMKNVNSGPRALKYRTETYTVSKLIKQPPKRYSRTRPLNIRADATQKKEPKPIVPDAAPATVKEKSLESSNVKDQKPAVGLPKSIVKLERQRPWISIFLDNVIDSADDIGTHIKRQIRDLPTTTALQQLVRRGDQYVLERPSKKPVVLVLGSGWGAHSLIKVIDTDKFEVICVSPLNHFIFTPLLTSTAVGTIEFRSLLEPIRVANPFVNYLEARCNDIDLEKKIATCQSVVDDRSGQKRVFQVPYDMLIVSIGEKPATFNVPGVQEHCYFMKEVQDSVGLRKRIQEVFEVASLPGTSEEEAKNILNFVIVGGGPTGVEFAGTLSDFVRQDLKKRYPELMKYIQVTLLQSQQTILTQFDKSLAERAMKSFEKSGVKVRTGVRVVEVTPDEVVLASKERINYGVCVWSAGNAPRNLVTDLASKIPQQLEYLPGNKPTKLAVDPFLRVIGAKDVISIGDCSYIVDAPLPPTAQVAGQQGAYAAHVINRDYGIGVGGMDTLPPCKTGKSLSVADRVFSTFDNLASGDALNSVDSTNAEASAVPKKETRVILKKPFEFLSLGIMASIGNEQAVIELNILDLGKIKLSGNAAELLYKLVYINKQVSLRNRVLILFDWAKSRVFGRDLSQF